MEIMEPTLLTWIIGILVVVRGPIREQDLKKASHGRLMLILAVCGSICSFSMLASVIHVARIMSSDELAGNDLNMATLLFATSLASWVGSRAQGERRARQEPAPSSAAIERLLITSELKQLRLTN